MESFNKSIFGKPDNFTDPTLLPFSEGHFSLTQKPDITRQIDESVNKAIFENDHGPACGALYDSRENGQTLFRKRGDSQMNLSQISRLAEKVGAEIVHKNHSSNTIGVINPSTGNCCQISSDNSKKDPRSKQRYVAQAFRHVGFQVYWRPR